MSNNSPNALNYIEPHKRLSQRIAIAQLRGETIVQLRGENLSKEDKESIKNFLIEENFLCKKEAEFFNFFAILETNENKASKIIDLKTQDKSGKFTFNVLGVSNEELDNNLSQFANLSNPSSEIIRIVEKTIGFINSSGDESPWSLTNTTTSAFLSKTKEELEAEIASLPTKKNGSPFNVLQPSKKLSQLIAQSWRPEGDSEAKDVFNKGIPDDVKKFLMQRGLLSKLDAQYATIKIDTRELTPDPNSTGVVYIGELTVKKEADEFTIYNITIPYPKPTAELISNPDILEEWVNSPEGEPPYTPEQISRWIPLTC